MVRKFKKLLDDVRGCTVCQKYLAHEVRPVLSAHPSAKILIVGQAPGKKVHDSGIPWDDQSGNRLREWMGVDNNTFYDESKIAIIPMGFCYPGKGKSGDLPPRPECAPLWHEKLLGELSSIKLTLLVGQYAQSHYLKGPQRSLTQTVKTWKKYMPDYLPLPHPSPRNFIWMNKNKWFEREVIPSLRKKVKSILGVSMLALILVLSVLFAAPSVTASGADTIGVPTSGLKNRRFTHPLAKDVYLDNDRPLNFRKKRFYPRAFDGRRPGKIYVSGTKSSNIPALKDELKGANDDPDVLISLPKKKSQQK